MGSQNYRTQARVIRAAAQERLRNLRSERKANRRTPGQPLASEDDHLSSAGLHLGRDIAVSAAADALAAQHEEQTEPDPQPSPAEAEAPTQVDAVDATTLAEQSEDTGVSDDLGADVVQDDQSFEAAPAETASAAVSDVGADPASVTALGSTDAQVDEVVEEQAIVPEASDIAEVAVGDLTHAEPDSDSPVANDDTSESIAAEAETAPLTTSTSDPHSEAQLDEAVEPPTPATDIVSADSVVAKDTAKPVLEFGQPTDLEQLPGAGPGLIWMLQQNGINSMSDLAVADPDELVGKLDLVGQLLNIPGWISYAQDAPPS
ncbi:MAG: hypothetical protein AAF848_11040 [Pseudomonadota bacterium]